MKFKIMLSFILISVIIFFLLRKKGLDEYNTLKQNYNFTLPRSKDGNLKIENPKKYIIFYSGELNGQEDIVKGLEESFKFSKVNYDMDSIATEKKWNLNKYGVVIIVAENYKGIRKNLFLEIKKYVENGGKLLITGRSYRSPFNKMAGIESMGEFIETKTFNFKKDIFPGFRELKPDTIIFGSSGIDFKLSSDVEIIAETNEGKALMWRRKVGKGEVFYNNNTLFQGKIFRGIMKQLVSWLDDVSFYPIVNAKVLHIDDFPSPIPAMKNKIIKEEYGMDTSGFFNVIWWKDMQGIAARQRLKFTGLVIADYNDATTKNKLIKLNKRTLEELSKRGRELKAAGGEIGLHGYNHYSLALKNEIIFSHYGYTPWGSIKEMEMGLDIAKEAIEEVFGKYVNIYSYVAPSNLLPKSGKEALINALPYINSICGIFYGEYEPGLLLQEVGRDPDFPQLYSLPRFSSGFFYNDVISWQILNGIAGYGYLSHFIHPDDIMDTERGNGKNWEYLSKGLEKIFSKINEFYPLLKPEIQSEMTYEYMKIEGIKVAYELVKNKVFINIEDFRGEFDAHFRLKGKKIKRIKGAEFSLLQKTDEDILYILTVKEPEVEIIVEDL